MTITGDDLDFLDAGRREAAANRSLQDSQPGQLPRGEKTRRYLAYRAEQDALLAKTAGKAQGQAAKRVSEKSQQGRGDSRTYSTAQRFQISKFTAEVRRTTRAAEGALWSAFNGAANHVNSRRVTYTPSFFF